MVKKAELADEQIQAIAKALADARRYEILTRLRGNGEVGCEALRACMDVSAATFSHHMRELELASLVAVERRGKFAYYRIRGDVVRAYLAELRRGLLGTRKIHSCS